ncbi:hypothetical protein [Alcanivorax sp. S71-1-4]|uniref:hypothetical protein n=1 Tax=Alcanivorax sp. S71-1-4 TaxID=1177159 RepID=UPI0013579BD1|nr:hypothetical protein [Alcanivorax sp. S71-1-4]
MAIVIYTKEDRINISKAKLEKNPWDSSYVVNIKRKMKNEKRLIQGEVCCYCLRDTLGEGGFALHLEHILPKGVFGIYIFDLANIAVSCVRCNMEIKRRDYSFLDENLHECAKNKWSHKVYDSKNYAIVHPNLDSAREHIDIVSLRVDGKKFCFYKKKTKKGEATFRYFKLKQMEIDDLDILQGISVSNPGGAVPEIVERIFDEATDSESGNKVIGDTHQFMDTIQDR